MNDFFKRFKAFKGKIKKTPNNNLYSKKIKKNIKI